MSESKCILVTGGAGFIGSHTTVEVLNAGYSAVIVDNLCNASVESVHGIEKITGKKVVFYEVDILDIQALEEVFKKHKFTAVMHFAGFKAVGESCEKPFEYYKNNVQGTLALLEVMCKYNVNNIVFSSSCTVYGEPTYLPLGEQHPTGQCTNPYGRTKYFVEQILTDICKAKKNFNAILLRYFNPVGSHKSGLIGEDPMGLPNNLMPFVAQVAVKRLSELKVYGNDYDTPDGTGVRDYIHVVDLALGHVASLKKLEENCHCKAYNLGTGEGYSVLEMVRAFETASGKEIPYTIADRRSGDVASIYAKAELAAAELNWKAERNLDEMCEDLWRWQSMNPQGFASQTNGNGYSNGNAHSKSNKRYTIESAGAYEIS